VKISLAICSGRYAIYSAAKQKNGRSVSANFSVSVSVSVSVSGEEAEALLTTHQSEAEFDPSVFHNDTDTGMTLLLAAFPPVLKIQVGIPFQTAFVLAQKTHRFIWFQAI
jgi:hypothetical protein